LICINLDLVQVGIRIRTMRQSWTECAGSRQSTTLRAAIAFLQTELKNTDTEASARVCRALRASSAKTLGKPRASMMGNRVGVPGSWWTGEGRRNPIGVGRNNRCVQIGADELSRQKRPRVCSRSTGMKPIMQGGRVAPYP
jgi:hypothetical protein